MQPVAGGFPMQRSPELGAVLRFHGRRPVTASPTAMPREESRGMRTSVSQSPTVTLTLRQTGGGLPASVLTGDPVGSGRSVRVG